MTCGSSRSTCITYNDDVRRKVAGASAVAWSLAVFDEAHRLTPTSQYLDGGPRAVADAPTTCCC